MDLLKGITRELRTGDTGANDQQATAGSGRDGPEKSGARPESTGEGESASASERTREEYLCPFCETTFDSSRGVCPECDAEIVLRGQR